jgi:hypothetical protein
MELFVQAEQSVEIDHANALKLVKNGKDEADR